LTNWITDTYLVKAIQYWLLRPQPSVSQLSLVVAEKTAPLDQHLATDPTELQRRVARYHDFHKQMVKLTTGANIPLVIAVQPEITGRGTSRLSPSEQKLLKELGAIYKQGLQAGYAQLEKATRKLQDAFPQNVKTLDFYNLYENFPSRAFYDAVHLTEEGNALLAEQLYQAIATVPKLQVAPPKKRGIGNDNEG
jgi:lysophospholipase L1-like esterase